MPRLLFQKTGNAVWMSHLDLMRVFQRAFQRAGLLLKHTQGYNPRPSVSIALPLSVGTESICELLDFDLDGDAIPCSEIQQRLNNALVDGVRVLQVYDNGRKIRELSKLRCLVTLEYDNGVPENCEVAIQELFNREALTVAKKSKTGDTQQDIIPLINHIAVCREGENVIKLDAVICCQNPSLNPAQLTAAISKELPQYAPDFSKICRLELYDQQNEIFR